MAGASQPQEQMGIAYSLAIDGLRAIAALCVLYSHMVTPEPHFAGAGVRLFFCISGYLITHILLSARAAADRTGPVLRAFYVRRILRIWPAYYAVLLAALMLDADDVRDTAGWHLTFTTNFWLAGSGSWTPDITSHLWTLAVEEQFYLLWPLAVLLAPRRSLEWIMAALPLLCALYIATLSDVRQVQEPGPMVLLPAQLDVLGSGALLALVERDGRLSAWWIVPVCIIGPVLSPMTIGRDWPWPLVTILQQAGGLQLTWTLSATTFVALVLFARNGPQRLVRPLLGNRPLVWLGRRSYGIYLYHIYLLYGFIWLTGRGSGWPTFIVVGGASVALAAVSWRFMEQPILQWKSRVPYVAPRGVAPGAHAV